MTAPGQRRSGVSWLFIVVLLLLVAATIVGIYPVRQIVAQEDALELAERQLIALEAENARLEGEIEVMQTPEEVERLAREQFGLVRPGEIGYVVVQGGEVYESQVTAPTLPPSSYRQWWEQVWDFMTGRDLGADG